MQLIERFHYILNKNCQDIVSYKTHFINKLNWDIDQYERIKEDTFALDKECSNLIKNLDENKFWLLADNIESLYNFLNDEISIVFDPNLTLLSKEEIYRYYIRLQSLVADINCLRRVHNKPYIKE